MVLRIPCRGTQCKGENNANNLPVCPRIDWSNTNKCNMYNEYTSSLQLSVVNPNSIGNVDDAIRVVDTICDQLTATMHNACSSVNAAEQSMYKGRFKAASGGTRTVLEPGTDNASGTESGDHANGHVRGMCTRVKMLVNVHIEQHVVMPTIIQSDEQQVVLLICTDQETSRNSRT